MTQQVSAVLIFSRSEPLLAIGDASSRHAGRRGRRQLELETPYATSVPVHTPILGDFEQTMGKETLDAVRDCVGRHGEVSDIVPVIAFLASPQSG